MLTLILALGLVQTPTGATVYENRCATCHAGTDPRTPTLASLKQKTPQAIVDALTNGVMRQQGSDMSDAKDPVFDRDGKYLYFTASTDSGPSLQPDVGSFTRPVTRSIYLTVLAKDLPSPFAPESDEEKSTEPPKSDGPKPEAPPAAPRPTEVRIDFDNIGQRILSRQQQVTAEAVKVQQIEREQQIKVQEAEIIRVEKELIATVLKQAEVERKRIETLASAEKLRLTVEAEGQAAATRARGDAEADIIFKKGDAEARAMNVKAEAFQEYNQAAVVDKLLTGMNSTPVSGGATSAPIRSGPWHLAQYCAYAVSPFFACASL